MPLILPSDLPATASLQRERIFTMSESEALRQDIRPIRIAIVNLMPKKEETELQLLRRLSNTALQVHIDLIRTRTYDSKNAKPSHLEKFYKTFEEIKGEKYD
ncbi:MAG TPA: homoserine O-succinyltransferase, partial [Tissierellia bacterium]|nr:homoserine O-succinyltransferase [Tissierellia bacterium]